MNWDLRQIRPRLEALRSRGRVATRRRALTLGSGIGIETLEGRTLMTGGVTEFPIGGLPGGLTVTADKTFWFTEQFNDRVGHFIPATGQLTFFNVPPGTLPHNLKTLPDGTTLMFTGLGGFLNFFDTKTDTLSQFGAKDGISPNSHPHDAIFASDGNVYFTEQFGNRIGEFNMTTHQITEFPLPSLPTPDGESPHGIMNLPNGDLLFCEQGTDKLAEFSPITHTIVKEYGGLTPGAFPHDPVLGSDGFVYFTELKANAIGRLDLKTGQVLEFPTTVPVTDGPNLVTIIDGPDGHSIWFPEFPGDRIGKFDTITHTITEYKVGITPHALPLVLTLGPDNNIWFSEPGGQSIARLVPSEADQFVVDPNRGYVAVLAKSVLAQDVNDAAAVAPASTALDNGTANRFQVALSIAGSHVAHTQAVQRDFGTLLGRAPTAKELTRYVGFLDRGGQNGQVQATLMGTQEYLAFRAGGSTDGFLAAVYQDVLNRAPAAGDQFTFNATLASLRIVHPINHRLRQDPTGIGLAKAPSQYPATFNQSLGALGVPGGNSSVRTVSIDQLQLGLSSGLSRSKLAAALIFSSEKAQANVQALYGMLLTRTASPAEASPYVAALVRGVPLDAVLASIAATSEFNVLQVVGPTPVPPTGPMPLLEV